MNMLTMQIVLSMIDDETTSRSCYDLSQTKQVSANVVPCKMPQRPFPSKGLEKSDKINHRMNETGKLELFFGLMLCSHQHRNMFRVNVFQRNTFPVNMFAISLFTQIVNFKTRFVPGAIIIYAVL